MRSILLRATAYTAGVLGGVCLVVRHLVDSSSGDVLAWVAAAFLAIAGLGLALKLVPTAPKWLQGVVSVGVVALVASVWVTLRDAIDHELADLGVGVVAIAVGLVGVGRIVAEHDREARPRGAHSS
ncbi:MAG TPA: hypothetical protein VIR30_05315 [Nocardioides sp.]